MLDTFKMMAAVMEENSFMWMTWPGPACFS